MQAVTIEADYYKLMTTQEEMTQPITIDCASINVPYRSALYKSDNAI
jgi:hypothetical protein